MWKEYLDNLKKINPLVTVLTNQVTINECANALLAIGASPVMSNDQEDGAELTMVSRALVLNIGTVSQDSLKIMLAAGRAARAKGLPIIFDPVGAGAGAMRLKASDAILAELAPQIIRGNLSEIKTLAGLKAAAKGVDAGESVDDGREAALLLAQKQKGATVAVTGPQDFITNGRDMWVVRNGHHYLPKITGSGCLLTAMIGGYAGANPGQLSLATAAAIIHLTLAGEQAAAKVGPRFAQGLFIQELFDAISLLDSDGLEKGDVTYEAIN